MAKQVKDLGEFIIEFINLLQIVDASSPVLFRKGFREYLKSAIGDVNSRLDSAFQFEQIKNPDEFREEMQPAGLTGPELLLKLESFQSSLNEFDEEGTIENLEDALDKGGKILSSLAGAIPGFGSFAQELVDFIIQELKRRFRFWKR